MIPIADEDSGSRSTPYVTYLLLVANVLVFVAEFLGREAFIMRWAFVSSRFLADPSVEWVTLFSSMFMHAGLLHIGGNMLYLWVFGNNVEDRFGHLRFLLFYLLSGVAATAAQMWFNPVSDVPNLGASGAIAGVLGAYLLMFPLNFVTVLLVRFIVPMPAIIVLGFWFVLQFFNSYWSLTAASNIGGVAYLAHVGGFVAGFIMAIFLRNRNRRRNRG